MSHVECPPGADAFEHHQPRIRGAPIETGRRPIAGVRPKAIELVPLCHWLRCTLTAATPAHLELDFLDASRASFMLDTELSARGNTKYFPGYLHRKWPLALDRDG